jgi:hypothetical protein
MPSCVMRAPSSQLSSGPQTLTTRKPETFSGGIPKCAWKTSVTTRTLWMDTFTLMDLDAVTSCNFQRRSPAASTPARTAANCLRNFASWSLRLIRVALSSRHQTSSVVPQTQHRSPESSSTWVPLEVSTWMTSNHFTSQGQGSRVSSIIAEKAGWEINAGIAKP